MAGPTCSVSGRCGDGWEMPAGRPLGSSAQDQAVMHCRAFSADDRFGVGLTANGSELLDLKTGKTVKTFDIRCYRAAFSRDGKRLALSGGDPIVLRVFDVESGKVVVQGENQRNVYFNAIGFAADDLTAVTVGSDGRIIQWRTSHDRTEWQMPGPILACWLAGDGRYLVTDNANGTGHIFRLTGAAATPRSRFAPGRKPGKTLVPTRSVGTRKN